MEKDEKKPRRWTGIAAIAVLILLIGGLKYVLSISPEAACQVGDIIYDSKIGKEGSYHYELWKDRGTTQMQLGEGGTFSCSWENINNALFRRGIKYDKTKTHEELGYITVDYACDYNPDGNSYLCVYGWSVNPLIEYYIVDSWGSWRPPGGKAIGQITVDGGTYDVYTSTRVNQPSIEGTATFTQYWSVRTKKRTSGTISVTEHFRQWEKLGLNLGKMYEVALTVEGYQSRGNASVTKNVICVGGADLGYDLPIIESEGSEKG